MLSPACGVLVEDRQRRSSLGEEGIIASRFKWDHVDTHRCFPWDKGRRLQSSWTTAKSQQSRHTEELEEWAWMTNEGIQWVGIEAETPQIGSQDFS